MFILVPAHPGIPGQRAVKRLLLLFCSSLWSPCVIGQTIIFSSCFFLLSSSSSSFFFLFFPRLISAVGDWMFSILWHMVWP